MRIFSIFPYCSFNGIDVGQPYAIGRRFIMFIYILLLLWSNPRRQHIGDQEKRKGRKTWKRRSKERVWSFSSASLLPVRKQEVVT